MSDLVLELHYTPNGTAVADQTRISLQFAKLPFAKSAPRKRVITLQLNNTGLVIPPGDANYHVTVWGTLPNDAMLLGFLPHMHLRGKAFEYDRTAPGGAFGQRAAGQRCGAHWSGGQHQPFCACGASQG